MSWREAWRLADPAYTELAFQAIYAVRQGNLLPPDARGSLSARARRRVLQSKALVSAVLGLVSLGGIVVLSPVFETIFVAIMPRGLYVAAMFSAILVIELTLLWWTGLQVLPAFLAAGIVPLLSTLPVAPATLRRASLILFLRLFDVPVATCLILTPLAVGIALGSVAAALVAVPAVLSVAVFALALALVTGRFFVRRVQGARGGHRETLLRWTYLVLWAIPAFAMYAFIEIAPAFVRIIAGLTVTGPSSLLDLIFATYPLPFASLPTFAAGLPTSGTLSGHPRYGLDALPVVLGLLAYSAAVLGVGRWLAAAPTRLAAEPGATTGAGPVNLVVRPGRLSVAVLRKDLRTASRTPGFAFLILLPLLSSAALGLWTFASDPPARESFDLAVGAIATTTFLATFFGPAFFAIEVMGYSYTRTLPLPERGVLWGKVALAVLIYLVAGALLIGFTVLRGFPPGLFLAFVAAELPAIVAASTLELGLLFRRARRTGLPIVNLFAGAWWAALVSVPGLIVAGAPLVLYYALAPSGTTGAIVALALGSLAEFAVFVPATVGPGGRRAA